ncbi:hypothetical protein FO519_007626 [Halicephalobus sp. NKZ332]|nr:hypothetical protein FO519_007626 [Halicephalobus sp. NKZ332]
MIIGVFACLLLGLKKENAGFLIPYLVYKIWWIIVSLFAVIISFVVLLRLESGFGKRVRGEFTKGLDFDIDDQKNDALRTQVLCFITIVHIINIVSSFWCFWVVVKCCRYFNKLNRIQENRVFFTNYFLWANV